MALSRRKLFASGAAFIAFAPAICKAEILMPVRQWQTFGPGGVLTAQMIADEAARLIEKRLVTSHLDTSLLRQQQVHADVMYSLADRKLSVEEYTKRILKPITDNITSYLRGVSSRELELPKGELEAVIGRHKNASVRLVSFYKIETDTIHQRIDVLGRA